MTVFSRALKNLLTSVLTPLHNAQLEKAKQPGVLMGAVKYLTGQGYKPLLSDKQAKLVENLSTAIKGIDDTTSDEAFVAAVEGLIDKTLGFMKTARGEHKEQPGKTGQTVTALTLIKSQVRDAYSLLRQYQFDLLELPFTYNPVCLMYSTAAFYLLEQVFNPLGRDRDIRLAKEKALAKILTLISAAAEKSDSLRSQKAITELAWICLLSSNAQIINMEQPVALDNPASSSSSSSSSVTSVAFSIYEVPLAMLRGMCSPKEGLMGFLFRSCASEILGMTPAQFQQIIPRKPKPTIVVSESSTIEPTGSSGTTVSTTPPSVPISSSFSSSEQTPLGALSVFSSLSMVSSQSTSTVTSNSTPSLNPTGE